jgi:hypothetical protein
MRKLLSHRATHSDEPDSHRSTSGTTLAKPPIKSQLFDTDAERPPASVAHLASPARKSTQLGLLASIATECNKAPITRPGRLSLVQLKVDMNDVESTKQLREKAEAELQRLLEVQEQLSEALRQVGQLEDSTPAEHAALAFRHLAEAITHLCSGACSCLDNMRDWCSHMWCGGSSESREAGVARRRSVRIVQPAGGSNYGALARTGRRASLGQRSAAPADPSPRGRPGSPDQALLAGDVADARVVHKNRIAARSRNKNFAAVKDAEQAESEFKKARRLEDKADRATRERWMWSPNHKSRLAWDLSMLVLIVYSCVTVPFRIGMSADAEGASKTFENAVTIVFIIDLLLNFNTAYAEGQYIVIDRCLIAKNYLRGWFLIDLASSFPYEAFNAWLEALLHSATSGDDSSHAASMKLLRGLRLFRLIRLLRLLKLQHYIDAAEDQLSIDLQVLQIIKMVMMMLYLMHMLGCFWFFTATMSGHETTWLTEYDGGSGLAENGATVWRQYLYSIYWALMTLTTVGYGDITPQNNTERMYALFALLIGALVFGYMLSSIGDLVGSLDKQGAVVQEKLADVKEFTRWHKLSPDLAAKVRKYYEFFYSKQGPLDDQEMVNQLAPTLARDVMSHMLAQTVCKVPFFYVPALGTADEESPPADIDFQLAVYPLLKPVVREAKEMVIAKGDTSGSDQLLFLTRGQLNVMSDYDPRIPEGRVLFPISEAGTFLSEHVLADEPCPFSFVAHTRAEFLTLDTKQLLDVLERFPHAREELSAFVVNHYLEHKRQRIWSLRFAMCERGLPEEVSAALRLQVCCLRFNVRRMEQYALLPEPPYAKMLPVLFGETPRADLEKQQQRKMRKAAARISVDLFNGATTEVGVLPLGGALTPKIKPKAPPPSTEGASTPASQCAPATSLLLRTAPALPPPGAAAGASAEATDAPSTARLEQRLTSLQQAIDARQENVAAREQSLQGVLDTLERLAAEGAASPPAARASAARANATGEEAMS